MIILIVIIIMEMLVTTVISICELVLPLSNSASFFLFLLCFFNDNLSPSICNIQTQHIRYLHDKLVIDTNNKIIAYGFFSCTALKKHAR